MASNSKDLKRTRDSGTSSSISNKAPRPGVPPLDDPKGLTDEEFLLSCSKHFDEMWDIAVRDSAKEPLPLCSSSGYKVTLFRYANLAVEFYNSGHQSNQFEVVDPLHCASAGTEYYHLSFIAKSKNDSSLLKLFFAQVVSSSSDTPMARECIIVEPGNPSFVIGCDGGCHTDGVIYHPFYYRNRFTNYTSQPLSVRSREYHAKKLLREAYVTTSYEQNLNTKDMDELSTLTCGYVYDAVRMYNKKHFTSFKPLTIVASVRFVFNKRYLEDAMWAHFIFKARESGPCCLSDAPPRYFFAERGLLSENTTTCVMMDDTYASSAYPGTETSCAVCREHCPNMKLHPEDFEAGRGGGELADVLDKDKSRMVKAKLEPKDGASSRLARLKYMEALEC